VEEQEFLQKNVDCFAFDLHDLGVLKGQEVRITLTDDAPIYRKLYKYSDTERKMIQARTTELVEAGLVEIAPSDCEYASATVMPSKKDIYGNWTEKRMCGDYRRINKFTKSDRYAMPTLEEALSVEVLIFWIEERTCRVSEGYGPSSLGLGVCEVLH
jgi:hypothetical protein